MSQTKKKSEAVAARSNNSIAISNDSLTIIRSGSKGSYDMGRKPNYEYSHAYLTLPNPKRSQRNGTLKSTRKSAKTESKPSPKLSKSVFYTNSDYSDESEKVYPASCTHTARPKDEAPLYQSGSVDDLSGDLSKSLSFQDLSSLSKTRRKTEKYGTLRSTRSQRIFRSMKLSSSSKLSINDSISDDYSDVSMSGSRRQLNASTESGIETYYQSYDDFGLDESTLNHYTAKIPTPKRDKCIRSSSSYSGDVWRDIGSGGGVVQIIGSDVSLHISGRTPTKIPDLCQNCAISTTKSSRPRKHSAAGTRTLDRKHSGGKMFSKKLVSRAASTKLQQEGPKLSDYDCPIKKDSVIDGRLVMGLEDPPDSLLLSSKIESSTDLSPQKTGQTFVIAGPAVRLDLKDARTIKNGSIIQLPTNVVLAGSSEYTSNGTDSPSDSICSFACLQSTSFYGPYKELKSCYLYGENLQAALDPTQVLTSTSGKNNCQIHVVPVVKSASHHYSSVSVWEGISKKSFHVGIYGPRYSYERNSFCVSVSSSGFNPPFLKIQPDKSMPPSTLRLMNSHVIVTHKVQGYKTHLRTSSTSTLILDSDLSKCVFTEEEMCTESRINRVFVLKQDTPPKSLTNPDLTSQRFIVELKGLSDRHVLRMKCKCPKFKSFDFPRALSPLVAQRLAAAMEISPAAVIESKYQDTAFQWIISQQEDRSNFHERKDLSATKREIFGVKLGQTLKSTANKNKALANHSHFLQYSQDEYLPLLSRYTLLINDVTGNRKEWWICYHKHNVGLIRTSAVKVLDFDEFAAWDGTRIAAGKLVNAVTAPVLLLKSEHHTIRKLLMNKIQNWSSFSNSLQFGQSFAATAIGKEQNQSKKEEKISFYLQKYMDYCSSCGKNNQFHCEVLKALLYSEHYDLALELVTDLALLNTATSIEGDWLQLASLLIGKSAEEEFQKFVKEDFDSETENIWRPMHLFLCYWRERFEDNHKGALFALHQAIGNLPETANSTQQILTNLVILSGSVESLSQYDTTL